MPKDEEESLFYRYFLFFPRHPLFFLYRDDVVGRDEMLLLFVRGNFTYIREFFLSSSSARSCCLRDGEGDTRAYEISRRGGVI